MVEDSCWFVCGCSFFAAPKVARYPAMPRPKFTTRERDIVFQSSDNPYGPGRCFHCGVNLADRPFDLDHHPVLYRDIESQLCCGVTNPKSLDNIVLSCVKCNRSHAYESTPWCGRSQPLCTTKCWACIGGCAFLLLAGVLGVLVWL